MTTTQFTTQVATSDGQLLTADVVVPDGAEVGLVVCHPHPRFGGNRFNPVVDALFVRAIDAGLAVIRFDFRVDHGGGTAETLDVVAALDEIARYAPGTLAVAGYSFGAAAALATADDRIAAVAAIAPPLAVMSTPQPRVPTLVLVPRHDQFTSVDVAADIVRSWHTASLEVVESADHFLAGQTTAVADRVVTWLVDTIADTRR